VGLLKAEEEAANFCLYALFPHHLNAGVLDTSEDEVTENCCLRTPPRSAREEKAGEEEMVWEEKVGKEN